MRFIVEYSYAIWCGRPNDILQDYIDKVQNNLFLFNWHPALYDLYAPSIDYTELLRIFVAPSLQARCLHCNLVFIRKVNGGCMDSPYLLERFSFHVPVRGTIFFSTQILLEWTPSNMAYSVEFRGKQTSLYRSIPQWMYSLLALVILKRVSKSILKTKLIPNTSR